MLFGTVTNVAFGQVPRPAFGRAAQHTATPPPCRTKAAARYQRAAKTAAELLPELPLIGTAHHCLMVGSFDLCQVIAATLKLAPHCRHLRIATLCFSKRNSAELLGFLETYPTLRLTLLVSTFFQGHNKELSERFAEELKEYPRARIVAARTHAKVVAFDLDKGDGLVFEGSANLRTNGNREQLTAIRDRALHDFHAGWIDELAMSAQHGEEAEKEI